MALERGHVLMPVNKAGQAGPGRCAINEETSWSGAIGRRGPGTWLTGINTTPAADGETAVVFLAR